MDQPENTTDYNTSWTSATNWSVASGNLESSVTFESSLSLFGDDERDGVPAHSSSSAIDSKSNSPLILYPPSPDSSPCEISITFAQKHEVRQVYVRSTARVYEIYYAPELRIDNEYLCTVRCSVAARDGEVLRIGDVQEAVLAHVKRSGKDRGEGKLGDGSNSPSGSEDDWVEVSRNGSVSSNSSMSQGRNVQDLYEATAEMNDTNPCMSLTLRLLSLQNKGCVCIDEVYVFADPVDATTSESQVGTMGNSAGNSLMAMLLPTFFQLSKTKDVGQAQDIANTTEKHKLKEVLSNKAGPSIRLNQTHQDGKSGEANQLEKSQDAALPPSRSVQLGTPLPVLDSAGKPDMSYSHIEGALYHLVSRVNRIEELFLRFEENMLKPISNIDERLHRVEQQLEVLTKKTQSSELLAFNRISAPEFSCSESETNSFYNNGSIHLGSVPCEAAEKGFYSGVSSIPIDSAHVMENTIHPSLVVTAPEFSNGNEEEGCEEVESDKESLTDEEEGCQEVESEKESPTDKLKKVVSIDDALASALAGFLSSTSDNFQKCSHSLAVKAPEFPDEEENDSDKTTLSSVQSETTSESTSLSEPDQTEHTRVVFTSLSLTSSAESEESATPSPVDCISQKLGESADEQNNTEEGGGSQHVCIEQVNAQATNVFGRNNSDEVVVDANSEKQSEKMTDSSLTKRTDSLEQFCGDQTDNGSDNSQGGAVMDEPGPSTEVTDESKENILQDVVDLSPPASVVDFKSPILEVKFISEESFNAKTPLEALLDGMPDVNPEMPSEEECASDGSGSQVGDERNLISVEDWGAIGHGTDNHIVVDMNYCSLKDIHPISESDKLEKYDAGRESHEISAASLI